MSVIKPSWGGSSAGAGEALLEHRAAPRFPVGMLLWGKAIEAGSCELGLASLVG